MKAKNLFQFILAAAIVFVAIKYVVFAQTGNSLDSLMSEEDMKNTGVYKLSTTEKIELKNWIDRNYVKKSKSPLSRGYQQLPTIAEVTFSGQFIRLDDDTIWQIDPKDTAVTQGWLTPVPIKVEYTAVGAYPYTLTNTVTSSKVHARKVSHIPSH
ncbi:MAG: hypothetical protein COT84_03535 [Chlamydiae bacterium CG10_big_fil_rev_8_21_14_0_10_35_9]|nr:MAG: hypothetical protein COT84_03535 [Chlamydiae bacterium CG10_big_fil_rev_8_21_14_0_10_35_9]